MPRIDLDAIEDEWEEAAGEGGPSGRHPRRGATDYSPAARERIARHDAGRVVGLWKGHVQVLYDGRELTARYAGSMRGTQIVVGDRVRIRPPRHETDVARVLERLDRDTVLLRTGDDADADDERVVVANADQVAVVLAADYLEGGIGYLDRVLVAASAGGLGAILVINKIDLVDDEHVAEVARRYDAVGVLVHRTSAVTGAGLDDLLRDLAGAWTAFSGHSGVGKTSLFNLLVPEADREVGEVGRRGGRHTTTTSRAMHIADVDAWLVDTPGVRSFGLGVLDPVELPRHFPELAGLACDLEDCLHDGEPGCRIDAADIHPERLASYRRLLAGLRGEA